MSEPDSPPIDASLENLDADDLTPWRRGAPRRAERFLAQATVDAARARDEPLAQRREVLLESARRLTRLAEAEMRVAADLDATPGDR